MLASLADPCQVGASAEDQIPAGETGHLRETKSGLFGRQNEGVIAPAGPGVPIRRRQQRIDFRPAEKADQGSSEVFAGDREDPLNLRGVLW